MLDLARFISQNLQLIVENGGYLFLFISTVLEGIPIIGQFVPGHTIVIIAGFLSKLHILNVYVVTFIVIVGAILGDIAGFFLGKKYGLSFLTKFGSYFFIKKEYIEKAQGLIQGNTAKTIIIGRLSPITRPLSPFIVGASGISAKKFWFFDSLSVILWSVVSVGIGYMFGASYHTASAIFGRFILIGIILGVLMALAYRFINKQFHVFAKYELITLTFNLFGLYLFFKTIQDALTDKVFLLELDLFVNNYFILNSHESWLYIMNIITNIMSPVSVVILGIFASIYFFSQKKYYYTTITIFSLGGGYTCLLFIKNIVERVRPVSIYMTETGYSFPSGHAMMAVIFSTLFIYIFAIRIKSLIKRELVITLCVILTLLVAFSRVYIGVHWLSDVIAGIGFGLFWTTLVILFAKYGMMIWGLIRKKNLLK